jgi:hypothetical protein
MNRKFLLIGGIGIVAVLLVVLIFSKRGTSNLSQNLQSGQKIIPKSATPTSQSTPQAAVPLPRGEDIVRTFFNLIGEGRISDAVNMLTPKNISDDSQKQLWGVMLNSFKKISIKSIEAAGENTYRVDFEAEMKPGSENAQPIPYYGFNNGINTRWVSLEKVGNIWKIQGLATGP